jgi:hypothetical protein
MATRTPARRTPARRTTTRKAPAKKGLSTPAKIAIGVGAAASIWLIYDQFFKKDKPLPPMVPILPDLNATQNLIDQVQNVPENIIPAQPARQLSPMNTPSNKLKYNSIQLFYGDQGGEIQEMQKLFNRVSTLYGQPTIKIDGVWGPKTEEKKLKIMGSGKGFTLTDVYKVVKANEVGKQPEESKNLPSDAYGAGTTKYTRALLKWNQSGRVGDWRNYITD